MSRTTTKPFECSATLHSGVLKPAAVGVRDDRSGEAVKIVEFRNEPRPKTKLSQILRRDLRDTPAAARQAAMA